MEVTDILARKSLSPVLFIFGEALGVDVDPAVETNYS